MAVKAPPRTLRALMAERGIYKDIELARSSGVSCASISRIASLGIEPRRPTAAKLAKALGFKVAEIMAAAKAAQPEAPK